ncbi:MAG: nuclear transport factor 2 family protein [Solirubrobacterales bacterium]|nr:nuclear transport factor 2 family protein [Solirubrobacterales bacterium]
MSGADRFRAGVEAGDVEAALEALADDVVLHSPVTFRPFEGKAVVSHVLRTVFEVFEGFRYTDHLREGPTSILVFKAGVAGREVDGIDLVREDADGLIGDFTVMVRPLSGLTALAEEMGRRLGAPPA